MWRHNKPRQTLPLTFVAPNWQSQTWRLNGSYLPYSMWICSYDYGGETKRTVGKRIKEHAAKNANNLSTVADQKQTTSLIWITWKVKFCEETVTSQSSRGCYYKESDQPQEFQERISRSQLKYYPLRTDKGFREIFGLKRWALLNSFTLSLIFSINAQKKKKKKEKKRKEKYTHVTSELCTQLYEK